MKIAAEISSQPVTAADTQKQAKLVDAAQQFEAMLMQEMLKPMQAGQDSWGGEQQNDDAAADTVSSFGTEAVAKAIAKGGGLGIAKQVIQKVTLEHQRDTGRNTAGTKV
jgi:Rod binding domain-containing protein